MEVLIFHIYTPPFRVPQIHHTKAVHTWSTSRFPRNTHSDLLRCPSRQSCGTQMSAVKPYVIPSIFLQIANVLQGAICLDTLGSAWSPVLTIKSALLSLQSLLSTPEPKDPQDAEVASMLMNHPEQFQRVAREWAIKHAHAPKTTNWEATIAQKPSSSNPKSTKALSRDEEARQQMLR